MLTWRHYQFFLCSFIYFVKFSYWSKFRFNIITGSGCMRIYFYKGLTWNPEIGNTPVWVLPNIWWLEQVRNTKFGMDVYNKMLLMQQNARVTAFTISESLREKNRGWVGLQGGKITQIRVKITWYICKGILAKSSFWYFFKPIMCKEGWCVKLGQDRVAWGRGNCLKYLKRVWNRKEGRGNKHFKKGASCVKGWVP